MVSHARGHTVGMIGLGYVGLSTAAFFVSKGIRVVGVDVERERVSLLSGGKVPIHEERVETLLRKGAGAGLISFHTNFEAIDACSIVFLTVGTPSLPGGAIDTSFVEAAAAEVGRHLKAMGEYPVVVVKSTVTPSTTLTKVFPILERESKLRCGRDFGLATNPEFLREGKAVWDMMHPDAIVIGKVDQRSVEIVESLYRRVYDRLPPVLVTDSVNAEFIKYGVNSIRAVQLSFINTLANMCSRIEGAQVDEVVKGLLLVARIDRRYSRAGLGFGGSCLPKDSSALISLAESIGVKDDLLSSAMRVNEGQAGEAIALAKSLLGPLRGRRISILGLTFKADTDDIRGSVGISLATALVDQGVDTKAFDPGYKATHQEPFTVALSVDDCLRGADCCIVTNEWAEFKELVPQKFKRLMARPLVVDGRGLFDIKEFANAGVSLRRVGVGPLSRQPS